MTEQPTSCPPTSSDDTEMSHICAECRSMWLIAQKLRQLGKMLLSIHNDFSASDTSPAAFAKKYFEKSLLILTGNGESEVGGTANERIIRTETPFEPITQPSMNLQTMSEQNCPALLSECPTVCHSPDDREHIAKTSAFKTDQKQLETSNTLRHAVNPSVELSNVGTYTCPCEYTGLRNVQKESHRSEILFLNRAILKQEIKDGYFQLSIKNYKGGLNSFSAAARLLGKCSFRDKPASRGTKGAVARAIKSLMKVSIVAGDVNVVSLCSEEFRELMNAVYRDEMLEMLVKFGVSCWSHKLYLSASLSFSEAIKYQDKRSDLKSVKSCTALLHYNAGLSSMFLGDGKAAENSFKKSLALWECLGDSCRHYVGRAKFSLGIVYERLQDKARAQKSFMEALVVFCGDEEWLECIEVIEVCTKFSPSSLTEIALNHGNACKQAVAKYLEEELGHVHTLKGNLLKANEYLHHSLAIHEQMNDDPDNNLDMALILQRVAKNHLKLGEGEKALEQMNNAMRFMTKSGERNGHYANLLVDFGLTLEEVSKDHELSQSKYMEACSELMKNKADDRAIHRVLKHLDAEHLMLVATKECSARYIGMVVSCLSCSFLQNRSLQVAAHALSCTQLALAMLEDMPATATSILTIGRMQISKGDIQVLLGQHEGALVSYQAAIIWLLKDKQAKSCQLLSDAIIRLANLSTMQEENHGPIQRASLICNSSKFDCTPICFVKFIEQFCQDPNFPNGCELQEKDIKDLALSMTEGAERLWRVGELQLSVVRYEQVLGMFISLSSISPDIEIILAMVHHNLGVLCQRLKRYKEALYFLSKALTKKKQLSVSKSQDGSIAMTLNSLGNLYLSTKQYSKAVSAYCEALSVISRLYLKLTSHVVVHRKMKKAIKALLKMYCTKISGARFVSPTCRYPLM